MYLQATLKISRRYDDFLLEIYTLEKKNFFVDVYVYSAVSGLKSVKNIKTMNLLNTRLMKRLRYF